MPVLNNLTYLVMSKNYSKKTRLTSLNARRIVEKVYDVTLSEFADSDLPAGKGRLKKASSVISHVRQISTSEDIDIVPADDEGELNSFNAADTLSVTAGAIQQTGEENNNEYTEYPIKIWLLLAEYIRPEDVKSFSLICKTTLSVVNTASFWIRLYKRCYRKVDIPRCLSRQCLDVKKCLKQKVVRSLYYYYPPYSSSVINNNLESSDNLIGTMCLHHGIQSLEEKESTDGLRWLYSFKLCDKDNESLNQKQSYGIHYNPEAKCRLLKFICKEFIVIPSVRGMRLRKMESSTKNTMLKFSSAPLSKVNSDLGTVTIHLDHTQKPVVIPWWHPDYWDHVKCCKRKSYKLPASC